MELDEIQPESQNQNQKTWYIDPEIKAKLKNCDGSLRWNENENWTEINMK